MAESRAAARGATARPGPARGQATVEVLATVPALLLTGLLCLQLLAAGYALTLAEGAAEAGAAARVAGLAARPAVEAALPGWAGDRVEVEIEGGSLTVRLRPPAALPALAGALEVSSTAWVRVPEGA